MVFFFYGPNSYAARRKIRDMAAAYTAKTGSDFGLERIDGAETTLEKLGGALTAAPFLANSRLVIIEGLGANKAVAEKFPDLLDQIPETTVAVIYESTVDQRTSYFKNLIKATRAVKFDNLTPLQLGAWIKREVADLGGTIEPAAINRLIEAAGDDQWRLEQEVNKLINYQPNVTLETVQLLVVASPTQTIFELVDAMTAGQTARAVTIFRQLVADRTSDIYILTMVIWQLRNLLLAKTAEAPNPSELAKRAGLSPFVAAKALARQKDFSLAKLKEAFVWAVDTDYAVKTGQGNSQQLVEQLIYKVATS